ncbi:MAG: radical SAM protein [Mobilitalea sp.]
MSGWWDCLAGITESQGKKMIIVVDKKFHYVTAFSPESGFSIRTNTYDEEGKDTGKDPFMGSFPELLDIGIMGHCEHGLSGRCIQSGVECYQNGLEVREPNLPLARFKRIIDECQGRTLQVALGGRGDPDMHEEFVEILHYSKEHGVVPNFTTSGFGLKKELLPEIKACCGAVAVSWYRSDYTLRTIDLLLSAGIKTNIHYCINKSTIDEAICRVRDKAFPKGINRIIFLLHKPGGLGQKENMLSVRDPRVEEFFSLFDQEEYANIAGFDSCSVPALLSFTKRIHPSAIEPCEASRFSAYISPDNKLYPCSFEKNPEYGVSMANTTIEDAWNCEPFQTFRSKFTNRCNHCQGYEQCLGGCPVLPEITICTKIDREVTV